MAIFSTLRSRRFAAVQTEKTEKMITFRLRQEWFALPILAVQKVIPLGKVYGDPQKTGVSITAYEAQEIIVIDVAKFIFKDLPENNIMATSIDNEKDIIAPNISFFDEQRQRYLVIINLINPTENLLGLPIDSQPVMRRISQSNFQTLPNAYLKQDNIKCVSEKLIELPEHPPIFLFNPQSLVQIYKL